MKKWIAGALLALTLIPAVSTDAEAWWKKRRATRSWSCASCTYRVKGHYRTSSTGKRYYVKSYTRKRGYGN